MDVVLEVSAWRDPGQYLLDDVLMIVQDLIERIWAKTVIREQVKEFTEGESSQVVRLYYTVQLRVLVLQSHYARSCEHDFQSGVEVVALSQFSTPIGLFEDLVDQQYASSLVVEVACEIGDAPFLEVEVVHVDVEALPVVEVEVLFCVLQQECGLSDASRAFDANHTMAPVDLIHESATNWSIRMFHQISMRSEESFHTSDLFCCRLPLRVADDF